MTLSDLRGLEQVATQAQRGEKFERRVFEVKAEAPASASSVATSPAGFAKAKQLLKAKQEADARASMRGSQKEEAMRKLHAAGVVSAKQVRERFEYPLMTTDDLLIACLIRRSAPSRKQGRSMQRPSRPSRRAEATFRWGRRPLMASDGL